MIDYNPNYHLLAIDFGEKFCGLATYRPGRDPFPVAAGRVAGTKAILSILKFIQDEWITHVVIGLPVLLDGTETSMTKKVRLFMEKLQQTCKSEQLSLQFFTWDETLSTYEAKDRMKNSPAFNFKVDMQRIDEVSALIILEEFIRHNLKKRE